MLIGNKGVGKTVFLQQLIGLDPFQLRVVYIHAKLGLDLTDDLYRKIIPVANSPDINKEAQLIEHLIKLHQQKITPVLIVDNAQILDDTALAPILKLSAQFFEQRPLLQLLFAADPRFPARFDTTNLLPFKSLISRQYRLDALTLAEIRDFIDFRLRQAGYAYGNLFSSSAIRIIASRSKGIPRLILKLCNRSLQQASLDAKQIINEKTVVLATENLSLIYGNKNDNNSRTLSKKNINSENPIHLPGHQANQRNSKNNYTSLLAYSRSRLSNFTFAAITLILIGIAVLFTTKPEQTEVNPSDEISLNVNTQANKLHVETDTSLSSIEQTKKHLPLQLEKPNSVEDTQIRLASKKTTPEAIKTDESVSKTLFTAAKPSPADSLILEPTNQTTDLVTQSPLKKSKAQSDDIIKSSKKQFAGTDTHSKSNGKKVFTENTPPQPADKRELQAKQRAEARLKLHQSGINFGIESLMAAAASGDYKTMELLLTGGLPADIQEQTRGFTALEIAAGYGHNNIIKLLVLKSGASLDLKNFKGRTALMMAAESGHKDTVDFLLSNGALVNQKDKNGWTALMFAAYNNHLQTAYILLDWGANSQLKNNAGRTAMQIARSRGNTGLIKMVTQRIPGKSSTSNQFNTTRSNNLKLTQFS